MWRLLGAVVRWLVALPTAAASLAPARPLAGGAALVAAACAVPIVMVPGAGALAAMVALAAGAVIALFPDARRA